MGPVADRFLNPHRTINETQWKAIQANAKAAALRAIALGSPAGLTVLEQGYYFSLSKSHTK